MSRRKVLYAVVVILSLLIAAAGVYRQVDVRRGNDAAAASQPTQRALVPAPLTVSLSALSDRRIAAVGASTYLAVNAAGDSISEVRLYDGAALVGVERFSPAKSNRASVQFAWPAVRAGSHVLHAEAVGAEPDQVGHSAPLRLRAVPAVVPAKTVQIPGNGRTPIELAAATGVDPGALKYAGADGKPVSRPSSTRPLAEGVTATASLDRIDDGPRALPVDEPRREQTEVIGTLDGCTASVRVTNGRADKVSVYEMTGGGAGFTLRGTATADAPYVTGELTPGTHVFVAGPADEPADSAPVAVEVPSTCLADAWSGKATLFDGELSLPKPEPRVWVYLGVDGQPFQRVPAQGSVSAAFGTADLANLMPTLNGSKVRMEVWRAGATPAAPATRVAQSESTLADATALADLIGGAPNITLLSPGASANQIEMTPTTTSVKFSWQTPSQLPDGVIWQVLGRPLSTADRNTAPPVLLATGYSADGDGGGYTIGSNKGGNFEVPAGELLAGRPVSGPIDKILQQVPTPSIKELVTPGSSFGVTPLTAPAGGSIPTLDAGIVPIPIGDVYLRVLPVTGDSVIGDASNTIAVTLPPLDPTKASFKATKVTFDPGRAANGELAGCVRVTGTPTVTPDPSALGGNVYLGSIYRSDGTWCTKDFDAKKGGGCNGWCGIVEDLGSLVSFVGQVWDYIATAYNTVVKTLITVIAKFNPFCATASVAAAISKSKYAKDGAEGCEAIGEVVGAVVVSAVLSSFGLPARLPTSKELGDVAEGDLTGLAVAYLETIGVPCKAMTVDASVVAGSDAAGVEVPSGAKNAQGDVDVCAAMIQQAVGAIREQVKQTVQAEVANTTGLPVPPAPQEYVLEPRGQYQGATVTIVAKPLDPNTAKTARCGVSARGDITDWKVGLYEAHEPRDIQPGYGTISSSSLNAFSFGSPWAASLKMRPIQDLVDFERISVSLQSSCLIGGTSSSLLNVPLREPLGYWYPGQPE